MRVRTINLPEDFPSGPWTSTDTAKQELSSWAHNLLTGGGRFSLNWGANLVRTSKKGRQKILNCHRSRKAKLTGEGRYKTHSTLNCVVCNYETSCVHSCPGCSGFVHVYCGRTEGEEGYGSPVWCAKCDLANTAKHANNVRVGIKRSQEKLHDRMISSAAKKFQPAAMGDNVVVPIERPDKMHSLGPRNKLGIVTDISEDIYTIGTRDGTLNTNYTRNQFEVCSSNTFIQPSNVPEAIISQTSAMRKASLSIEKNSFCRCKHCKTTRCPCKKSSRSCGTKCHKGTRCFNS